MSNRISFIELEVKKCQLVYGSSPCTAAVGVTGERKCFNSRATCQDLPNIDEANELVRLAKPSSITPQGVGSTAYIPNVASISYSAPVLDLGRSIGVRGSLSVSFKDHRSPDTDASGDPYLDDRDYDPYTLGTYFGKLKARHPFMRGQSIYWVNGRDDQDIADMERRHFIVEETAGPNSSGTYGITAKDALKLAQGDRALAPRASQGYVTNPITDTATSILLSPVGIGALEYPSPTVGSPAYVAIGGKEIVAVTNRSGDVLTIVRAQYNTDAVEHDTDDRVQLCLVYISQSAAVIFEDLLVNYSEMLASYIPLSDWVYESDTYINRVYSTLIPEPTPVDSLINELLEQTGSNMWWDSLTSTTRWSVLKNPDPSAFEFNESNYMQGSFNVADQFSKRVSRVIVRYGQINPLLSLDDERNYASGLVNVDADSEAFFSNTPAYRNIYSRWVLGDSRDTASTMAELITQRYAIPPRKVGFKLLRDALSITPDLSGAYLLKSLYVQDDTGAQVAMPIQVTSVNPGASDITVNAEEITFTAIIPRDPNAVNLSPENNYLNYNIYDRTVRELGTAPTASTVVTVFLAENFVTGSMTTGAGWPAGAVINIYVQPGARILGAGGNGGVGGSAKARVDKPSGGLLRWYVAADISTSPEPGIDGGTGLEVLHDINLYNNGIIGGGGGGGGGGGPAAAAANFDPEYQGFRTVLAAVGGNGGSGGAGFPAGNGGASGTQIAAAYRIIPDQPFGGGDREIYAEPTLLLGSLTVPVGGLAGGLNTGGGGLSQPSQISKKSFSATVSFEAVAQVESSQQFSNKGQGGNLGSGGADGADSFSSTEIRLVPSDNRYSVRVDENGASAGAAGAAIFQNGGTVNFIITGDIRGAIL